MRKLLLACLAVSAILMGCVSTKTYKAAVDESEMRRTRLEKTSQELADANKSIKKLQDDIAALTSAKEKEAAALQSKIDELSSRGIMTSREIEDLKKEKDRLADSDRTKSEEISALKAELDKRIKEKEYLSREVERLQLKAGEISSEKEKELANVKSTYENLVKELKTEIEKGDIKITQAVDRLSVNMVEKILFDSGRAEVKPSGLKVLKRVGDILKGVTDKQIRVEGYTDNVPIGAKIRSKYPTNWELSTTRATNVVRYLQDRVGLNPKLLSAAGFAENKPVASNDTPDSRAQNRRIEIVLLPLDIDRVLEELKK